MVGVDQQGTLASESYPATFEGRGLGSEAAEGGRALSSTPRRWWGWAATRLCPCSANVVGTRNAIDAAARAGAGRFVHISSMSRSGSSSKARSLGAIRFARTGCRTWTRRSRARAVVLAAHAAGEIACTVVRPGDVYGPGPYFLDRDAGTPRSRAPNRTSGNGQRSPWPRHVEDLVDGVLLVSLALGGRRADLHGDGRPSGRTAGSSATTPARRPQAFPSAPTAAGAPARAG